MGQTLLTPASIAAPPENADLTAQVMSALRQAIPPETVREQFGLSREQFHAIIREMNQKALAWLDAWETEDSGEPDEDSPNVEKLLRDNPLSLRECSFE